MVAYNSGMQPLDIEVDFADVGFGATTALVAQDLYRKTAFACRGTWVAPDVPPHGVRMLRVSLADRSQLIGGAV